VQRAWAQCGIAVGDGIVGLGSVQASSGSGGLSGLHANTVSLRWFEAMADCRRQGFTIPLSLNLLAVCWRIT
jgi:hypothetical protein